MYAAVASAVVRVSEKYRGDDEDYGDVGAVVGATWPEQLQELRALMPRVPLLVPGYGSQGGTSADAAGAFAADGLGAVVNSSRGINFAWRRPGYQERFGEGKWREAVAASIQEMIADLAENTAAGELRKQL
jgi:orotidine-5'-phosphate decarboxylase